MSWYFDSFLVDFQKSYSYLSTEVKLDCSFLVATGWNAYLTVVLFLRLIVKAEGQSSLLLDSWKQDVEDRINFDKDQKKNSVIVLGPSM